LTFPKSAPLAASVGYCITSPNTRYDISLRADYPSDFTDIYTISTSMGASYFNTAEHGYFFMGIDCPSSYCTECNLTNTSGYIYTPDYSSIAWQQNISVAIGTKYQFSGWVEDRDSEESSFPGALVSIVINSDTLFSDIINFANGYGGWKQVTFCWIANDTTANIQIIGQGAANYVGYDYSIDNFSFASVGTGPKVSLTFQSSDTICNTSAVIHLFPSPTGGTLSGKGVWGNLFYPDSGISGAWNYFTYTIDSGDCSSSITDSVYINLCEGVAVIYKSSPEITCFPNPSRGKTVISYTGLNNENSELLLTDISGRIFQTNEIKGSSGQVNADDSYLANGLYFYQIISNNRLIWTGKFIIAK
jgi:hypothetical protein